MSRGRHTAKGRLPRDLIIMLGGIVVVGAVVFGALWLGFSFFDDGAASIVTTSPATSSGNSFSSSIPTTYRTQSTDSSVPSVTSTLPAEPTTPAVTLRPASAIVVQVLNAVGTTGLASDVTAALDADGYDTVAPDDYEPVLARSQILFRDGFGPEAFELAALVPDAEVGMSSDVPAGVDIIVLLGGSYEAG